MRKRRRNVKLATKLLKSNYEKSLMKAMLHITARKQKKQKEKIISMDFELNHNIKLPHQLYQKHCQNQEDNLKLPTQTKQYPQTQHQITIHTPGRVVTSQLNPHTAKPFPQSLPSLSEAPISGPATATLNFPSLPIEKGRNLEPSNEKLQMHTLKSWIRL